MTDESAQERLIRLAGREHVSGYERSSAAGNRVHVSSYFRDPGKMSLQEIAGALDKLSGGTLGPKEKNYKQRLITEQRKRGTPAETFKKNQKGAKPFPGDLAGTDLPGDPTVKKGQPKVGTKIPRKLDPNGDILAQYKSGQGMWNSKGVDDYGKEAASRMTPQQLRDAMDYKRAEHRTGMSSEADLTILMRELEKRTAVKSGKSESLPGGPYGAAYYPKKAHPSKPTVEDRAKGAADAAKDHAAGKPKGWPEMVGEQYASGYNQGWAKAEAANPRTQPKTSKMGKLKKKLGISTTPVEKQLSRYYKGKPVKPGTSDIGPKPGEARAAEAKRLEVRLKDNNLSEADRRDAVARLDKLGYPQPLASRTGKVSRTGKQGDKVHQDMLDRIFGRTQKPADKPDTRSYTRGDGTKVTTGPEGTSRSYTRGDGTKVTTGPTPDLGSQAGTDSPFDPVRYPGLSSLSQSQLKAYAAYIGQGMSPAQALLAAKKGTKN